MFTGRVACQTISCRGVLLPICPRCLSHLSNVSALNPTEYVSSHRSLFTTQTYTRFESWSHSLPADQPYEEHNFLTVYFRSSVHFEIAAHASIPMVVKWHLDTMYVDRKVDMSVYTTYTLFLIFRATFRYVRV
jgi:hypothetical protein